VILRSARDNRRGFALTEALVACAMSMILIYVVAMAWTALDRSSAQVVARCALAREADLAFAQMADDLRGVASSRPDTRSLLIDTNQLQIVFADRTFVYSVQGTKLIREDSASGLPPQSVAWSVEGLQTTRVVSDGPLYEVRLTLGLNLVENRAKGQALSRTFVLAAVLP
jgi:hypothetical protein